jgi:hypothetical protein
MFLQYLAAIVPNLEATKEVYEDLGCYHCLTLTDQVIKLFTYAIHITRGHLDVQARMQGPDLA